MKQIIVDSGFAGRKESPRHEEHVLDPSEIACLSANDDYKRFGWHSMEIDDYFLYHEIRLWTTASPDDRIEYFKNIEPEILSQSRTISHSYEGCLDRSHPCFAPKIVACIDAWKYTVEKAPTSQATPKSLIKKWLKENKEDLGFELSEKIIKDISAVANYRTQPGAISLKAMKEMVKSLDKYNLHIPKANVNESNN